MNPIDEAPVRLPNHQRDAHRWQALRTAQEFCQMDRDATVTVDIYSCILDYSLAAARLLGRGVGDLLGQPLSQLIKHLPFDPNTPGYNLAYAVFNGAHGRWQRHTTTTPQGQVKGLDVALNSVMMNGSRAIQLTLRAAGSGQHIHCH